MSILIAHPGTQHAHHLVRGLIAHGRAARYSTSMQFGQGSGWENVLPASMYRKRFLNDIPDAVLDRHTFVEFIPQILKAFGADDLRAYGSRNRIFQRQISDRLISKSECVIGFDTSSLILARRAKSLGIPFYLELTTPHPLEKQKWEAHIREHYPEWPLSLLRKSQASIEEEERELETADLVVAPARYVKQSHVQYSKFNKEMLINPLGADLSQFRPKTVYSGKAPRFLFLGGINAPKGVPVLLEAWRAADPKGELVIAGSGEWPSGIKLPPRVTAVGRIEKSEREKFFHSGDVFISPSFYDGFGLVQIEAAACGLAVIGSLNSAGPEILADSEEALFINPADVNDLAKKITFFSDSPEKIEAMGRRAAVKSKEYSWDTYVSRWISAIDRLKSNPSRP